MATPPRSAPEKSLSEPSRRPIGVRAPATMTPWWRRCARSVAHQLCLQRHRWARGHSDAGTARCRWPETHHGRCRAGAAVPRLAGMTEQPQPCFTAIDHVGVAVPDLDAAIAFYRDTFGMSLRPRGDQRGAGRPRGDDGRRRRRLLRPAAGPAHPGVDDRDVPRPQRPRRAAGRLPRRRTSTPVSATLRERGLRLLYDEPRRGTAGSRINFVHPKDAGGVLVELVEPAAH